MAFILIRMEHDMKDNGLMTNSMDRDRKIGQTSHRIKEIIRWVLSTERVVLLGKMVPSIMALSKTTT